MPYVFPNRKGRINSIREWRQDHPDEFSKVQTELSHRGLAKRWSNKPSPKDRLKLKCIPEPFSNCWLWTKSVDPEGYGCFWMDNRTWRAHVAAWTIYRGEVPEGLFVLHKCDVPGCVNPDHLFLGTQLDNRHDSISKNRQFCKLTREQLSEVRSSPEPCTVLAKKFGVDPSYLTKIRRGDRTPTLKENYAVRVS